MGNSCNNAANKKRRTFVNKYPNSQEEKQNMVQPFMVKPCPNILQLEPGKQYLFCCCGLSKSQPFCDHSHQGTKFKPIKFVPTNKTNILCDCKKSKILPFCDNTHKKFMNIDF